jgi:hypothetical protein
MGQPVYGRVTPDGYPDVSSGWLSDNDLIARFNFAVALTTNGIKGTKVDIVRLVPVQPDDKSFAAKVAQIFLMVPPSDETQRALDKLVADMHAATLPAQPTMTAQPSGVTQWTTRPVSAEITNGRIVTQLAALTLGSPEFQRK